MYMASSSYSSGSPCAACKFLRRKCLPGCVFAPYFPPEEPQKFANVHKIFGASNVSKLLHEIRPEQREDAVTSLAYEAEARVKDPVYGCVGAISVLQSQLLGLQKELDATNADLFRYSASGPDVDSSCAALGPADGSGGSGGFAGPNYAPHHYGGWNDGSSGGGDGNENVGGPGGDGSY